MTSSESLRVFADKFERAGFRSTSLMPTYGMAENGLAITMTPLEQGPEFDTIDLQATQANGFAEDRGPGVLPSPVEARSASSRRSSDVISATTGFAIPCSCMACRSMVSNSGPCSSGVMVIARPFSAMP
jgi:hypothetical protein